VTLAPAAPGIGDLVDPDRCDGTERAEASDCRVRGSRCAMSIAAGSSSILTRRAAERVRRRLGRLINRVYEEAGRSVVPRGGVSQFHAVNEIGSGGTQESSSGFLRFSAPESHQMLCIAVSVNGAGAHDRPHALRAIVRSDGARPSGARHSPRSASIQSRGSGCSSMIRTRISLRRSARRRTAAVHVPKRGSL
jgi:hypothetical protein